MEDGSAPEQRKKVGRKTYKSLSLRSPPSPKLLDRRWRLRRSDMSDRSLGSGTEEGSPDTGSLGTLIWKLFEGEQSISWILPSALN